MRYIGNSCLIALVLCTANLVVAAEQRPSKPPPPAATLPEISKDRSVILCPRCDKPFDAKTHKVLLSKLAASHYTTQLRKALYWQDTLHQFESKAHFDNCDFDASLRYITELLEKTDGYVTSAVQAGEAGDSEAFEDAVAEAFFVLGQAIHSIQDFYAHSNYVELMVAEVTRTTDIRLVPVWRPDGRARVAALHRMGLISGFVFWGFPQRCPSGTLSHGELAKDSADTGSGALRVSHLRNYNQYQIAKFLARESSLKFMEDAFKRWPLLEKANGPHILIDVMVDRRDLR